MILGGTFDAASFAAIWGGSAGQLSTSSPGGLNLFPGPGFVFDGGTYVGDITGSVGFSLGLSNISAAGIKTATTPLSEPATGIFIADLLPFAVSNGSVNTSGTLHIIPEPSSFVLAAIGLVGLVGIVRRKRSA